MTRQAIGFLGTGSYLPERTVSNEEIAEWIPDITPEWIVRKTAIRSRRFAAEHDVGWRRAAALVRIPGGGVMTVEVKRVGVVGCGLMGSGFADLCARAGLEVNIVVSSSASAERDRARMASSYDRRVSKGKLTEAQRDAAQALISFSDDLDSVTDCQFVLEAVGERLLDKLAIFGALDRVVADPEAILATNTSSIPIMKLGRATADRAGWSGCTFSTRFRSCRWAS